MNTKDVDRAHLLAVVFDHYGYEMPISRRKILCPVHVEDRPSAVVDPDQGKWTCFACMERGDGFDIIRIKESVGFSDAVKIAEGLLDSSQREVRESSSRKPSRGVSRGSRNSSAGGSYVPSWVR